jgi:hypothetical protein
MTTSPQQMTLWIARFAMHGYPSVLGLNIPGTISGAAGADPVSTAPVLKVSRPSHP